MAFIDINVRGQTLKVNARVVTAVKVTPLAIDKWGVLLEWLPKNAAIVKLNNDGFYETQVLAQAAAEILMQEISDALGVVVYKPAGSLNAIDPALLIEDNLGNVYNMKNAFTTTDDFLEGAGHAYPAGTNIVIIEDDEEYKFDSLSGIIELEAEHIFYDNTLSGLSATNVQEALDEIKETMGDNILDNEYDSTEYTFRLYIDSEGDLAYELKEIE